MSQCHVMCHVWKVLAECNHSCYGIKWWESGIKRIFFHFWKQIIIILYFHVISVFSIYPDVFKIHITGFYIKQKVDVMNKSLIDIFKLFNSMIGYQIFYSCDILNLLFSLQQSKSGTRILQILASPSLLS